MVIQKTGEVSLYIALQLHKIEINLHDFYPKEFKSFCLITIHENLIHSLQCYK